MKKYKKVFGTAAQERHIINITYNRPPETEFKIKQIKQNFYGTRKRLVGAKSAVTHILNSDIATIFQPNKLQSQDENEEKKK